jgi:hypothetical protein
MLRVIAFVVLTASFACPTLAKGLACATPEQRGDRLSELIAMADGLRSGIHGEQVIGNLLREDLSYSLDATMFSATAGSTARPAGILNGVTGQTAKAGGTTAAMNTDIRNLFSAISAVGSIDDIVLIASPAQAAALALHHVRPR